MKLNRKTKITEKIVHLLITTLCDRNCKYCCNKQHDVNKVPIVSTKELKRAETICLTGGEPFAYSRPNAIALLLKRTYENIKNVYVYTNAVELAMYLKLDDSLTFIDGVSVSIKNKYDLQQFENYIVNNKKIRDLSSNRLYVFDNLMPKNTGNFFVINRVWQKNFVPNSDSIFRRFF